MKKEIAAEALQAMKDEAKAFYKEMFGLELSDEQISIEIDEDAVHVNVEIDGEGEI